MPEDRDALVQRPAIPADSPTHGSMERTRERSCGPGVESRQFHGYFPTWRTLLRNARGLPDET